MEKRSISIGDVFQGRYEVLSELSQGGFGEVYRARQLTTGQIVAIKTLRRQHFAYHERQLARFRRESELCATLHHPHIVGLIDYGTTKSGLPYTVFEFVPGRDLRTFLRSEGPLSPREAIRIMGQVLDALSCAHQAHIIHRDLKPANIMLLDTGVRRNAMVLDFGIGAILPSADDMGDDFHGDKLTATFEQLGTPAYAAPEQLRGDPPSPASDLYAWGLVFIECLTGARAVPGKTAAESIHHQLSSDPVALPDSLVGHPLGTLLASVTAKDVSERNTAATELLLALDQLDVTGLKVESGPPRGIGTDATASLITPPTRATTDAEPRTHATRAARPRSAEASASLLANAERRQITAVCCSIALVTDDLDHIDVEDQDQLLDQQQHRAREIVEGFDGYVASVLGHQMLFFFGYPSARADDARRAALASLALQAALTDPSESNPGVGFDLRIGVHTGLIIAKSLENASMHAVRGGTPELAVRLAALATPGTIVISEVTRRLLGSSFVLDRLSEQPLRGSSRPVQTFRLMGRDDQDSQASGGLSEIRGELVGREQELSLLRERWHQSRQGRGSAILVSGEAGIGKSRLVHELVATVEHQPHTRLEARCAPESRHVALQPLIDMFTLKLGLDDDMSAETMRARLDAMLTRYGLATDEYLPLLATLLGIPPGDRFPLPDVAPERLKVMIQEAVVALLGVMADNEPMLLSIEDLHWADASTIELMTQVIKDAATSPMCVVFTARPEFEIPWSPREVIRIELGHLSQDGVKQLVLDLTDGKALPREVVEEMIRRTNGIPLFVEELTLSILESGVLSEAPDGYRLVGSLADLDIPATLRDSLMARLDRLGQAKAIAQLAAVVGSEFSYDLLRRLSPVDEPLLEHNLGELVEADILQRRRRLGGHVYLFKHALIQDIAYGSLLKGTRRDYHGRIATVLQEHFTDQVAHRPDVLAQHLAGAGQTAQAVSYAIQAGQMALSHVAYVETEGHMQQALGWLEELGEGKERDQLELNCNLILMQALVTLRGGMSAPDVEQLIGRCQTLVDRLGDRTASSMVLSMLCMYHLMRAQHDQAFTLTERYLAQANEEDNPSARMDAIRSLGLVYLHTGRFQEAVETLDKGIALYDALPEESRAPFLGYDHKVLFQAGLCVARWSLGRPERARAEVLSALEYARSLESPMSILTSLLYLGGLHHFAGEREAALQVATEMVAIASGYGAPQYEALGAVLQCWAKSEVGHAEAIVDGFASFGQGLALPYWYSLVAETQAAAGQLDAALERIQWCRERAQSTNELYYLSELYRLEGDFLRQRRHEGDIKRADECYRSAISIAREQSALMYEFRASLARYQLHETDADGPAAKADLVAVYERFTESLDVPIAHDLWGVVDTPQA
ncbi:TOMM system kinase/cyclase fusion protein [Haliangium sp.]|uniref:TOMM system kinase/cyclase fusion protein n=1 Tax=Haliangium sp. TaxID=2663208 RepID=UPI003D10398D